jgi:hypothetical protein
MKIRHNKKRNTAFLFEALVREITKSVVSNRKARSSAAKAILAEHFRKGSILARELDCYVSLTEKDAVATTYAEKLLEAAKSAHKRLDAQEIFKEQSEVIKKINKNLGKSVYNNFVPNYKSFATIAQIFTDKVAVKSRVLMEAKVVGELSKQEEKKTQMKPVDNLVLDTFSDRLNKEYKTMLPEQKDLLGKYIVSFGKNEMDFRLFAAKELKRIKEEIERSKEMDEVCNDESMITNTNAVLKQISEMNVSSLSEKNILKILKLQKLASEYQSDAN